MNPGEQKGILAWFAHNHVAANLLMAGIVVAGLLVARTIKQAMFAEQRNDENGMHLVPEVEADRRR